MLAIRRQFGSAVRVSTGLRAGSMPVARASQLLFAGARSISTEKISHTEAQEVLVQQRKNRPLSPDLAIYKPQITTIMSGLHRITGIAIGGAFYAYTLAVVVGPWVGLPFNPAGIAAVVGGLPFVVKAAAKFVLAFPFVFHSWNGVRHLIWDAGSYLTIPGVYKTGYVVAGLTAVSAVALAFLY